MNGPNNKIISYDPGLDIIRIMRNGTEYNIQGDVIAELWDYYVQGRPDEYDICESCPNVEQEHGRWDMSTGVAVCTACGQAPREFYIDNSEKWPFCPLCGAIMDAQEVQDGRA